MNTKKSRRSLRLYCEMVMENSQESKALLGIMGLWVNALNISIDVITGEKNVDDLNKALNECETQPLSLITSSIIDNLHQLDKKSAEEMTAKLVTSTGEYDDVYGLLKECLKYLSGAKKKHKVKDAEEILDAAAIAAEKAEAEEKARAEEERAKARAVAESEAQKVAELEEVRKTTVEETDRAAERAKKKADLEKAKAEKLVEAKKAAARREKSKTSSKKKKKKAKLGFSNVIGDLGVGD